MQAVQLHPSWSKIGLLSCGIKLGIGLVRCFLTACVAGASITESTLVQKPQDNFSTTEDTIPIKVNLTDGNGS